MAALPMTVRRALTREQVEQLASQATGEQALPTVYLRLAGEQGGADRFVVAVPAP